MVWRIGLVGVLAALLAGCLAPPAPGGAGDAAPVDTADVADVVDGGAVDRPDVPVVARDVGTDRNPTFNLLSDPRNCGAPGVRCTNVGAMTVTPCVGGRCACVGNRSGCGTLYACAFDLDTDHANCGSCGTVCSDSSRCNGGHCAPCPDGYATCSRADVAGCADSLDTNRDCGACGHACPLTERCLDRRCQACPVALTLCYSVCVDQQTDHENCGRCGIRCGVSETCTLGRCVEVPCPEAGTLHCDRASPVCTSVLSDAQNCGACGVRCVDRLTSTEVCAGGACVRTCRPGYANCGDDRSCSTELAFSDDHCGGCGVSCGALGHCIGGVCTSLDARPIAPLSTVALGVQRPRFRWERASGVDGVRLQLCADRACTRVESTRDLSSDEHRPDAPLTPGVHFWRLFARRGGVVSASPSPVWEFVVPSVDTGREVTGFLPDIDGDGIEDVWVRDGVRHSLAPGDSQPLPLVTLGTSDDVPPAVFSERADLELGGDIDGDGFGDLVGSHIQYRDWESGITSVQRSCAAIRGGGPRFASRFNDVAVGSGVSSSDGYDSTSCQFVFDLNGDGYGDIASRFQYTRAGSLDEVRFGGRSGWTTPASSSPWAPFALYTSTTWGDFDGDGRMDLLHVAGVSGDASIYSIELASFARGVNSPHYFDLPRCEPPGPAPDLFPANATVLDANRDGFDDVRVDPHFGGIATYFGGPTGFTRCVYDATGP